MEELESVVHEGRWMMLLRMGSNAVAYRGMMMCHDEYSTVVVVVFVNLKICETLCKSLESTKEDSAVLHKPWATYGDGCSFTFCIQCDYGNVRKRSQDGDGSHNSQYTEKRSIFSKRLRSDWCEVGIVPVKELELRSRCCRVVMEKSLGARVPERPSWWRLTPETCPKLLQVTPV